MNPTSSSFQYILPPEAESPQVREFGRTAARDFSIPAPLGEILHHRGLTTLSAVQDFFYPQLSMLPSPDTMKGMHQAVACILDTVRAGKPIFIHGDYDVDGITATVLLVTFLKEVGIKAVSYIPNRLEEKYGLSLGSIDRLIAQSNEHPKGGVLLSVDCGITAIDEAAYARSLGLRVIITDHHEPKEKLPEAEAILNPKQKDCTFPFSLLSGVGVAFFLTMGLRKGLVENGMITTSGVPNLKKYLDLVALGTIADVVPLVGVNRILVKAGLEVLSAKHRPGVFSLCESCGLAEREIVSEDIAFKLAPRINASGRLGLPQVGFNLLASKTREQARHIASAIEQMNIQRKQLEVNALTAVELMCEKQVQACRMGLAVYQENCHPGVLGILASRITDRYGRPTIVFTDEKKDGCDEYLKGSGRSVPGVNLLQILEQCSPWIKQFGGHAMAIGMSIKKSDLDHFARSFQQILAAYEHLLQEKKAMMIDYHFHDKSMLTKKLAAALQLMQPFGEGNPEPKFLLSNEQIVRPREVRGHLSFQVQGNGHVFPGIGFHLADSFRNHQGPVDLVFQLKQSWFRGIGRAQVQALHFASH